MSPIWKYKVLIQYADILKHVFSMYHTYFHRFFEAINSNFITAFLIHLLGSYILIEIYFGRNFAGRNAREFLRIKFLPKYISIRKILQI